jgi:hypothetical protein
MAHRAAQTEAGRNPGDVPGRARGANVLLRASEYVLLAAVFAGLFETLRFALHFIPLPFAVDYQEGSDLLAALRITHGLTPYPPIGHPPYIVNVYGPVYYFALAPLVKWFGLGFTAPRLFVLASGLTAALFLILLLRRWTRSWAIALGFGLLFLATGLVRDWIYILRVDLPGLALVMAGLYLFVTGRRVVWPALFFLAALYAKITFLAAPIACFLYLLARGKQPDDENRSGISETADSQPSSGASGRRRAWRLAFWMTVLGLVGLVLLGVATRGWGLFQMFLTHTDPYSFPHYVSVIRHLPLVDALLLVPIAGLAVRDIRDRSLSLPLIYFALASGMTLTAGKFGSASNHLLEWQAAACLAAGCGYHALRTRWRAAAVPALIAAGMVALLLPGLPGKPQINPSFSGCDSAYRFARSEPGALLAENPGAAVLSGKNVWLSSSFEYAFLGKAGRLDQRPLSRLVDQRFFGVILLDDNLPELERRAARPRAPKTIWPPSFVAALAENYHPAARFACLGANVAFEPNVKPKPAHDRDP